MSWAGIVFHENLNLYSRKCQLNSKKPGPEVIKLFSCSTHLSMKFEMLISIKISRNSFFGGLDKSRKENPQKLTQLSSRSHPRHLAGKRTAQKDITIDSTSDSQVNSNFPNRWSPASLTFNNYFYLFLYLYIT